MALVVLEEGGGRFDFESGLWVCLDGWFLVVGSL